MIMKAYTIANLLVCITSLCFISAVSASPAPLDADNVGQALGMVSLDNATKESTRKLCDQLLPADKFTIDYYFYKWIRDNSTELAAIQVFEGTDDFVKFKSVRDAGVNISLGAIKLLPEEKQKQYCTNYVIALKNGDFNLSVYTPKASGYLVDYSKRYPLTPDEQGDIDFKNGCIGAYLNHHGDYDVGLSACNCTLHVIRTEMTSAENAEMLDVENKKGDIQKLPQAKRIAPDIQKCATGAQH